jgi:hypothetical protein
VLHKEITEVKQKQEVTTAENSWPVFMAFNMSVLTWQVFIRHAVYPFKA